MNATEPGNLNSAVEQRTAQLLSQLTLEEKLSLLGGVDDFFTRPVERLGIPRLCMADGPAGVRNFGPATAFPAGIALAATWDPDLVNQAGRAIGLECRAKGVHILLGPGLNIYRTPLCGRNFEYYGEDPYLAGRMAVQFIRGVQSQGVAATAKHFAANNQEWDRDRISSDLSERTLQEIYLPAFRAAVQEGEVGAVMTAYNLLNGVYCSENEHLVKEILKEQWDFQGLAMSDWGAVHDPLKTALAGLDLEMPGPEKMNVEALLPLVRSGALPEAVVDDKVRRLLRLMVRFGFLDRPQLREDVPLFNPGSRQVALQAAREAIVLLKNDNRLLPLDRTRIRSVAVVGPLAHPAVTGGGGSSKVDCYRAVSILDGILALAGPGVTVNYHPGILPDAASYFRRATFQCGGRTAGEPVRPGMQAGYFANSELAGEPVLRQVDPAVDFRWPAEPVPGLPAGSYSVCWEGWVETEESGGYQFLLQDFGACRLFVDNRLVLDRWYEKRGWPFSFQEWLAVPLEGGRRVPVRLEFAKAGDSAEIRLACIPPVVREARAALRLAAEADVAIVCAGFNALIEKEGVDRPFELPPGQADLIREVARRNPRTVVLLTAGGNVQTDNWLDQAGALLHLWYPGQEGGRAAAEILFGDIGPSGKLPVSFEKTLADNPCYGNYYDSDGDGRVAYREGIFTGYRTPGPAKIPPLFPFGFGLSYTSFSMAGMQVVPSGEGEYTVQAEVTNTGSRAGEEVVQLYAGAAGSSIPRPYMELKGFTRIYLPPGKSGRVSIPLRRAALMFFHPEQNRWVFEPANFRLMLGFSSADIRLETTLAIQ